MMLFLKSPFGKEKNNNNNLKSKLDYSQTSIHKAASVWEGTDGHYTSRPLKKSSVYRGLMTILSTETL